MVAQDGAGITLVVRDPVPPIHLTCKHIHPEAVLLHKRLSNRNSTLRVILDFNAGTPLFLYIDHVLAITLQVVPICKLIRLVSAMCGVSNKGLVADRSRTCQFDFGQDNENTLMKFLLDAWYGAHRDGPKVQVAIDGGLSGEALSLYLAGFMVQIYPRPVLDAVEVFDAPRPARDTQVCKGFKRIYRGVIGGETWKTLWK